MSATEQLDQWAALADGATPRPWTADGFDVYETGTDHGEVVAEAVLHPSDARFIAASREAVPALIAALRAVLDLHESSLDTRDVGRVIDGEWTPYCEECGDPYPCAEVRAIDAALGVTS
jgi:hypothetical protein